MLHGIHTIAQLRYVLGDIAEIYLRTHRAASFKRTNLEGTLTGTLTLATGIHVTLMQTCEVRFTHDLGGYVIYGDKAAIRATARGYTVYPYETDPIHDPGDRLPPQPMAAYPDSGLSEYAQELEAFADVVAGASNGTTTGRSERRSLAAVEAGAESIRSGQAVNLRQRFGEL
jgi:predicted dehydrogenase